MAETDTYKQVFVTYPVQQQDGNFYHIDYVPQYVPVEYPKTTDPIPAELQGKIAKYDWQTSEWIDSGIDPTTAAITALQANAAMLMLQFTTIKSTLAGLQKQISSLTNPATTTTKEA
ncbi:hypothetical protein LH991_11815 [Schleiferilactobacillus harbinensis]|uniref:hypothetical protein n=1 Tax=Schleiferilactobacillus harbinensis TaxID=304207 RepID=UPI0004285CF2|nr:hypothetical protein [Schleiferilactobacillus harbinensis]QFR64576.1 hypothetical protein LH991_11815 [Schleiferilactobacillus harbinensis]